MQKLSLAQEKQIRSLKSRHGRKKSSHFLIEGMRVISALLNQGISPDLIVVSPRELTDPGRRFAESLSAKELSIAECDSLRFRELSDTATSQGLIALVNRQAMQAPDSAWGHARLAVYLDGVADPGNLGTIIRTCAALKVGLIALSPASADIGNPKVLRSTAGAIFAQPIAVDISAETLRQQLISNDMEMVGTAANSAVVIEEIAPKSKLCIALGSEATGLSPEILELCSSTVRIPSSDLVESLNVASAAAIAIYLVARRMNLL